MASEFDRDKLHSFLHDEIIDYYRHVYLFKKKKIKIHKYGRGILLHDYVKGLLFFYAKSRSFLPLPEYTPFEDNRHRIDMLWTNKEGIQLAAFEIDNTIYPKSISKLSALDKSCRKFIVSVGLGTYPLPANILANTDIENLDFTQTTLGITKYFYDGNSAD